ncbi:MAG: hypothetical protein JWN46_1002 [Acidimicrobiales bacterium]|nr:hypothetical protein [Acidimicrobiales bacterium]
MRLPHHRSTLTRQRLARAATGALAGAAGTAAMDAVWYARYRRGGGTQGPLEWELGAAVDSWEDASSPGKVGQRLLRAIWRREPPEHWARTTQTVVHLATGMGWGMAYGVVAGSRERPPWAGGLALGPVAWLTSYATLPLLGVYKPIWEYDAKTLADDLSAHLVFGATTGAVDAVLARLA